MAKFVRKNRTVSAVRIESVQKDSMGTACIKVHDRIYTIYVKPGDWLIDDGSGRLQALSDTEFFSLYDKSPVVDGAND